MPDRELEGDGVIKVMDIDCEDLVVAETSSAVKRPRGNQSTRFGNFSPTTSMHIELLMETIPFAKTANCLCDITTKQCKSTIV
jgi:hypothetical protein